MTPVEASRTVKDVAHQLGFDACGICRAQTIGRADYLRTWLDAGRAGSMAYLHRYFRRRTDPRELLPGARSVIVVALIYDATHQPPKQDNSTLYGRIARYAHGRDYHKVLKRKLHGLADVLRDRLATSFDLKACVDTAPVLERELAAASGVGWIGKNTLVLHRKLGSYFFLGELITTLDLAPDDPVADHCGTCSACLDACPTNAFPAPYEMDASRCISYLTIEHRAEIPESFHAAMGDWVFGCDICQEVCPYNRKGALATESDPQALAIRPTLPLQEVLEWSEDDYRSQLAGSAMKRARLDMLKRNARIVLQNIGRDRTRMQNKRT